MILRKWRARRAAERTYWQLNTTLGDLHDDLAATADPETRARILRRMDTAQQAQARVHDAAFGFDSMVDPDGEPDTDAPLLDMASSMLRSAQLYRCLADVELAVQYPRTGRRHYVAATLGQEADDVLSAMAALPDLDDRMALLPALGDAVYPVVGGQAAETVFCLPWPGKVAA
jgi:hypothetical protein